MRGGGPAAWPGGAARCVGRGGEGAGTGDGASRSIILCIDVRQKNAFFLKSKGVHIFNNLVISSFELLPLILSEISKHTHTHSLTPHVCDVSLSQVSTMRVQHVNIRVH